MASADRPSVEGRSVAGTITARLEWRVRVRVAEVGEGALAVSPPGGTAERPGCRPATRAGLAALKRAPIRAAYPDAPEGPCKAGGGEIAGAGRAPAGTVGSADARPTMPSRRFVTPHGPLRMSVPTVPPPSALRARPHSPLALTAKADRAFVVLLLVVAVGALLRFATLAAKSYWLDEWLTLGLVHRDFGPMLHHLHVSQPDPPLYFVLAWIWARVAGYGEVGLRSLSALAGTLTVPAAFLAARALVGRRGALVTAALVAVNPFLIWYSQDARTYALFALLGTLSLWLMARAMFRPDARTLAAWSVTCALMLAAHYFAIFLIGAEACWLLWSARRRLAPAALSAIALLPLLGLAVVASQARAGPAQAVTFGGGSTLPFRVVSIPAMLLSGFEVPHVEMFAAVTALPMFAGAGWLLRRGSSRERRGALVAGTIGVAVLGLPVVAALLGHDFLNSRNVIVALVPLWIVVGAGLATVVGQTTGRIVLGGLCAVGLAVVALTAWTPKYHYQDWRSVAGAMGAAKGARAVVVSPDLGAPTLGLYLPRGARPLTGASPPVSEIDIVGTVRRQPGELNDAPVPDPGRSPTAPARGFRLTSTRRTGRYVLLRFVSSRPRFVTDRIRRAADFADPSRQMALVQPGPR